MPPFMKPEAILRRSEDLLALGTPQSEQQALESLMEVFQSKRFKQTPLTTLEPIVEKFLTLCASLRKPRLARDALSLYRIAAQQVSVPSIEKVVENFLKMCQDRLAKAEEEMKEQLGGDDDESAGKEGGAAGGEDGVEDDLELPLQPATLLADSLLGGDEDDAGAVAQKGGADAAAATASASTAADRSRVERAVVLPWLRFCWEAYKSCLDITKSNSRLEVLYQQIALRAFAFCRSRGRRSELRRLCEQLRKDVVNAQKYTGSNFGIDFSDTDTLARHLDTRFAQLDAAVELELWQEAFRTVEDIHALLTNPAARKAAKPAMMRDYYEKLTKIFSSEGEGVQGGAMAVFHAAAWARYLQFAEKERERKEARQIKDGGGAAPVVAATTTSNEGGMSSEKAHGCVLLSALAVPLPAGVNTSSSGGSASAHTASGVGATVEDSRNTARLVALLNLGKMPTRASLLKDALGKNVLRRVPQTMRDLYRLVEVDFHPLDAARQLAPIVEELSQDADYAPYIRGLRQVVLSRLFRNLSELYSTVGIKHVLELVEPFAQGAWKLDERSLEKFLMSASKRGELALSIDHVARAIAFTSVETSSRPMPLAELTNLGAGSTSSQLARVAAALANTVQWLDPEAAARAQDARQKALAAAAAAAEDERKSLQHRQAIVARRRQKLDEIRTRREKEETSARAERERQAAIEAQEREQERVRERERDRVRREIEAIRAEEAKKLAETLKARGALKVDVDQMDGLDTDHLLQLQAKQIEKEQKEVAERTRIIAKRVDHLERALRREERPLIEADYERQKEADREAHHASIKAAQQAATERHQHDLALKQRLGRMMDDYARARQLVESKRAEEFAAKRAAAEKKIAQEKEKLKKRVLAERAAEEKRRKEEDAQREREEREAEERRAAEEKAAEEQRIKDEELKAERERARAEREAQRAADAEKIKKQLEREEEALRRREAERSGGRTFERAAPSPSSAAPAASGERPKLALAPRSQPVAAASESTGAAPVKVAPAAGGAGGWRERAAAKAAAGGSTPPTSSSTPPPPAASSAPTGERRRLNLQPPSQPRTAQAGGADANKPNGDRASSGAWRRSGA